jgi:tetratricopeptide (TPR) repeat protein
MKKLIGPLVLMAAAATGWAQCHKLEIGNSTKGGGLLRQIDEEQDSAKKLSMLDQFAGQYPQHEDLGWVYEQMLDAYTKAGNAAKAFETGEKLAAIPPECVENALATLKAVEMKKDPAAVLKWSAKTSELARKAAAAPQPAEADEVESWKAHVDYAKQVDTYTEYSLYAMALQMTDAQQQITLLEALQQRNAKSEYLAKSIDTLFLAYQKTGANDKALALAQQAAAIGQPSEDMLLILADDSLKKKDAGKVHAYTGKIIEIVNSKAKPDGVAGADWTKRKNTILGLAYYMSGKQNYNDAKFAPADKDLRAALPLVESNVNIHTEVLYLLGYANYKLEKIQDAANFYKQCAAVKGPFQALATKNLAAIRAQYHGMK